MIEKPNLIAAACSIVMGSDGASVLEVHSTASAHHDGAGCGDEVRFFDHDGETPGVRRGVYLTCVMESVA